MRPVRGDGPGMATAEMMAGGGAASSRPSMWRTPTPYLFLGFAVMMGLIVVALLVLICTRRRASSREAAAGKVESVRGVFVPMEREAPRFVVIMAGDALPSFLASAKPLAFASPPGTQADAAAAAV